MTPSAPRGRAVLAVRLGTVVAALALTACSGSAPPEDAAVPSPGATFVSTVVNPATLTVGQAVAAPTDKPVLTVTGLITAPNRRDALVLDLPTLERMGTHEVAVHEPWVKQDLGFRGVWLQDLLTVAGVQSGATRLRVTALDDYSVEFDLAEMRAGGILIATADADGAAIPIDQGGPTRIVFMDGVPAGVNPDHWVWSLKTIDVG
jgi:hypothetical protein